MAHPRPQPAICSQHGRCVCRSELQTHFSNQRSCTPVQSALQLAESPFAFFVAREHLPWRVFAPLERARAGAALPVWPLPGCSLAFSCPQCPFDEGSKALGAKHAPPLNTRALIGPLQPRPLEAASTAHGFIFPPPSSPARDTFHLDAPAVVQAA